MIKAIIFDWGGVLIDDPADGLIEYCANSLGIDSKELKSVFSRYEEEFQKGLLLEKDLWEKICNELKVAQPSTSSLWKEAVINVFIDKKEVYQLVSILKINGYKLGFLSNTEIPTMEYFYDNGYDKYFDEKIFSCVEKTAKPEKYIYNTALKKLGVRANEAVFIDDRQEYIKGARQVGIHGIIFENSNQLKEELAKFKIKIK